MCRPCPLKNVCYFGQANNGISNILHSTRPSSKRRTRSAKGCCSALTAKRCAKLLQVSCLRNFLIAGVDSPTADCSGQQHSVHVRLHRAQQVMHPFQTKGIWASVVQHAVLRHLIPGAFMQSHHTGHQLFIYFGSSKCSRVSRPYAWARRSFFRRTGSSCSA